jgi:hypothetical protein
VSSIGKVGDNYMQNLKTLPEYYGALDSRQLGCIAARADARRRHPARRDPADHVLRRTRFRCDRRAPRHRFRSYFEATLAEPLDGLAHRPGLRVLPPATAAISAWFRRYLPSAGVPAAFSKAI